MGPEKKGNIPENLPTGDVGNSNINMSGFSLPENSSQSEKWTPHPQAGDLPIDAAPNVDTPKPAANSQFIQQSAPAPIIPTPQIIPDIKPVAATAKPVPVPVSTKSIVMTIGISVFVMILAGGGYLYWTVGRSAPTLREAFNLAPTETVADISLGGNIYENVANPIAGIIVKSEVETPVANPIEDAYFNPFE